MIDCGFRLSANNFLFVADTDTCKITLYRLLRIIQPIISATLINIESSRGIIFSNARNNYGQWFGKLKVVILEVVVIGVER